MKPFVKWAGGKSQLVEKLLNRTPDNYNMYYEPFIGGGAFLFALKPKSAVINDINEQLINIYNHLQACPLDVIRAVKTIEETPCSKEYYYKIRDKYNEKITKQELDAECAGLMIWINKHCFNGLYRVNSKGLFNVPYNNNKNANSIEANNLIAIGEYMSSNSVQIKCEDFEELCHSVKKNDFVYFDSPYVPVSETAMFTDYTKDGFSLEDHKRLATLFKTLDKRGAKVMLSNHDVPLVWELYDGYNIERVNVKRNINSKADKRTGKEVIITNYKTGVNDETIL